MKRKTWFGHVFLLPPLFFGLVQVYIDIILPLLEREREEFYVRRYIRSLPVYSMYTYIYIYKLWWIYIQFLKVFCGERSSAGWLATFSIKKRERIDASLYNRQSPALYTPCRRSLYSSLGASSLSFPCVCTYETTPLAQWAHRPMKSRHNLLHTWLRLHKRSLALKTWLSPWWTRIKRFFFSSSLFSRRSFSIIIISHSDIIEFHVVSYLLQSPTRGNFPCI